MAPNPLFSSGVGAVAGPFLWPPADVLFDQMHHAPAEICTAFRDYRDTVPELLVDVNAIDAHTYSGAHAFYVYAPSAPLQVTIDGMPLTLCAVGLFMFVPSGRSPTVNVKFSVAVKASTPIN